MRAGMLSVDAGQYEAAQAIGMGRLRALRRIILPQAMRVVIPPLGNEFIGMVKATSLASVIQYPEVLHNAENIYYANSRVIELLIVAGLWYLARRVDPDAVADAARATLRPRRRCRSPDDPAPRRDPRRSARPSGSFRLSSRSRWTSRRARCCA